MSGLAPPDTSSSGGDPKFRQLLYRDAAVRSLIERLLSGDVGELTPILDSSGKPLYLEAVEAVGGDKVRASALIDELTGAGVLEKRFLEMWVGCPGCGSMNVSILYQCPSCNSLDIYRRRLYEHVTCGTLDSLEHFKEKELFICPKCGKPLREGSPDFREVGSWFECRSCKARFDEPKPMQRCRSCGLKFWVKDIELHPIYTLTLSGEAREEYNRGFMLLNPIKVKLEELGYRVEMPGILTGSSGATHKFDIIAWKSAEMNPGEAVVVDAVTSKGELDEAPVAAMFAKAFDVKPKEAIIVAIPRLREEGRKLAQLYKIKIVEAEEIREAAERMEALLLDSM
ncbi:MAG: hypothetical protein QXS76_02665 [Candidatus Bathyarchaeia archaeon]